MDALSSPDVCLFGSFRFDRRGGVLLRCDDDGRYLPVSIGSRAFAVLGALLARPGDLVSRDEIMRAAWPGTVVEEGNLAVQVSALRRILDAGTQGESCIKTVSGRGYRFVPRVTRQDVSPAAGPAPALDPTQPLASVAPERASARSWRRLTVGSGAAAIVVLLMAAWSHGGWLTRTPVLPRLSIVVLPFQNLSADASENYLADGITEDVTTVLSHIGGAFVIARATAFAYRGRSVDIRQLGQHLGVRYVLRGSVQRIGSVLRINAELGSTETGTQLWSDGFDQKIDDLAAGQEEIVIRMQAALNISLGDVEASRSLSERPSNPDAFDLILRARAVDLLPRTKDTVVKALGLYEQALTRDPNAILALTGAVEAALGTYFLDVATYDSAMDRAVGYLERAQALAPNAESVLLARSAVLDFQQNEIDYRRVQSELEAVGQKIIDLYPNNPAGYFRLGVVRRHQARYDEAAGYFSEAVRLNPRNHTIRNMYWNLAYCYVRGGHDQEGLKWIDRAIGAEGALPAWRLDYLTTLRVVAYARSGDLTTAKRLAQELNDRDAFNTWRAYSPDDPESPRSHELQSFVDALRTAGVRDHVDADADFGVAPDDVLHEEFYGKTPTTAPGVTTVGTAQLADMLQDQKPLVIDTMKNTWLRSIPDAVGIEFNGNIYGSHRRDAATPGAKATLVDRRRQR
jgi:adenylate cyclase